MVFEIFYAILNNSQVSVYSLSHYQTNSKTNHIPFDDINLLKNVKKHILCFFTPA